MNVRVLDRIGAALALVALAPVLLVIAVLVRVTSRGPAFHRARRCGRNGEPFTLLKFRTMVAGAERLGPGVTAPGDARITRVGRLLRATKVDELPQLLNVVRGEMAFVGPRPEDPRYVADYTAEQRAILRYPPGITSPASIRYRDEATELAALHVLGLSPEDAYRRVLDDKLAIDATYMAQRTLLSDLRVIWATCRAAAGGRRRS